jgi:cell division protein FtsB
MSAVGPAPDRLRSRLPRIADGAVERARLTVVPRRVGPATRVPFVVLVSLLLLAGVAGLLLFNTHMQQASFLATSLEEKAQVLDAREQTLKMQLETLRDPQLLAVRAREMGMVPPANPAFIRLSDGEVLGRPSPATAEDAIRIRPLPTRKPKSLRPDPVIVELPKSGSRDGAAARDQRSEEPRVTQPPDRDRGEQGTEQERQRGSDR